MTSDRNVLTSAATRLVVVAGLIAAASWAPLLARADEKDIAEPTDSKVNVLTYDNYFRFIERHPLVLMEVRSLPQYPIPANDTNTFLLFHKFSFMHRGADTVKNLPRNTVRLLNS